MRPRRPRNQYSKPDYGEPVAKAGPFHPGEPVCVLRAADPLVLEALKLYAERSKAAGRPDYYLRELSHHLNAVAEWQAANPRLVPNPGEPI